MKLVNINQSDLKQLHYLSHEEIKNQQNGKGWSFSNSTSLALLKNVYLLIRDEDEFHTIGAMLDRLNEIFNQKISERNILEPLNILRNCGYIQQGKLKVKKKAFEDSVLSNELTKADKNELKNIFFQIFRFREVMKWFLVTETNSTSINEKLMRDESNIIFSFSWKSRFTDSIIYNLESNTPVFSLEMPNNPNLSGAMFRFWDAFTSWGRTLDLLEKVNMKYFDYYVKHNDFSKERVLNCNYFKNSNSIDFDLISFIKSRYKSKVVYIPDLVLDIVLQYRFGINEINKFIIDEYQKNQSICYLERTSEIFITRKKILETDAIPFPVYMDAYISHFILR